MNSYNRYEKNVPGTMISRSKFDINNTRKLTCKTGELVPFYLEEVLPGDTFKISMNALLKMLSPAVPVMDNAKADIRFFYVPSRIACQNPNDWAKIIANENVNGAWYPASESTLENTGNTVKFSDLQEQVIPTDPDEEEYYNIPGSALNHLGIPIAKVGVVSNNYSFSLLPIKAYGMIWNEYYRDENLQKPLDLNFSSDSDLFYTDIVGYRCLRTNKLRDRFTSCLPSPQKAGSVLLPLGEICPVQALNTTHESSGYNITFDTTGTGSGTRYLGFTYDSGKGSMAGLNGGTETFTGSISPNNLYADLANATSASINDIRNAFALQRLFEKDARGGTRYREAILSHFLTKIPDNTVQVPEYLGGFDFDINIDTILQTSETTNNSHLGAYGAFSNTFGQKEYVINKSFTEWGYVFGLITIRVQNSYSQGISKLWTRNRRFDWYDPTFANLGEMPIYKDELFINAQAGKREEVFGYNEAWCEYRDHPNEITGYFATGSLDTLLPLWTYQTVFSSKPSLSSAFMLENTGNFSKTLVASDVQYYFIAEFYIHNEATRPLPVYSIPGLIDHN